jgi:hypothetical protein
MPVDLSSALRRAEDYLRRQMKSKAVREAEKRQREWQAREAKLRWERQTREAGKRLGRATAVAGVSGAGIAGYTIAIAPLAPPLLAAAGAAALIAATAALAWPSARTADQAFSREELAALPFRTEEWLLRQRAELPLPAYPILDRIFGALGDIYPHLGRIEPHSTLAWDARRLLGNHLPRLIEAYLELPASARESEPEYQQRLAQGLEIVADELVRLAKEVCRESLTSFEVHGRFIEARYSDDIRPR